jgi:hypothetical protein
VKKLRENECGAMQIGASLCFALFPAVWKIAVDV